MAFLAALAGGASLVSGLTGASRQRKAAGAADPFAGQRGGYQDILASIYGVPDRGAQRERQRIQTQIDALTNQLGTGSKYKGRGVQGDEAIQAKIDALQGQLTELDAGAGGGAFGEDFLANIPGLSFAIEQGTKAATRRASALGLGRSGNLLEEIARVTTGTAQQRVGEEIDRLASLSGATSGSPGTAATLRAGADPLSGAGSFLAGLSTLKAFGGEG